MKENDEMEDVVCDVCYDTEPVFDEFSDAITDEIVLCSNCNVAVH